MGRGGGVNPIERLARRIEHRKLLVRCQIIGTLRARGVWRRHQRRCLQEDIDNLREAYAEYSAAVCVVFAPAHSGQHA
jgi:hypothetical protein